MSDFYEEDSWSQDPEGTAAAIAAAAAAEQVEALRPVIDATLGHYRNQSHERNIAEAQALMDKRYPLVHGRRQGDVEDPGWRAASPEMQKVIDAEGWDMYGGESVDSAFRKLELAYLAVKPTLDKERVSNDWQAVRDAATPDYWAGSDTW